MTGLPPADRRGVFVVGSGGIAALSVPSPAIYYASAALLARSHPIEDR